MQLTKFLIYKNNDETYGFAYCDKELSFVTHDKDSLNSEAIFMARVSKLNASQKSAFVEYHNGAQGFINLSPNCKVQDGSLIPVQLVWLGDEQKQAKLRSNWQLIGKYLVYSPNSQNGIHAKHLSADLIVKFQEYLTQFPGQWILRSSVNNKINPDIIKLEMEALCKKALSIKSFSGTGLILQGMPNYLKLLRSLEFAQDCEITTNDQAINDMLIQYQDLWEIDSITYDKRLDCEKSIALHLSSLATNSIPLSSGAQLEIHTVAGINIIDINSSRLDLPPGKLNFVVLDQIYRQICLRNLQGIILLDVIKNMTISDEGKITDYLIKLFKNDISHTKILGFTKSGLCELIRNRF